MGRAPQGEQALNFFFHCASARDEIQINLPLVGPGIVDIGRDVGPRVPSVDSVDGLSNACSGVEDAGGQTSRVRSCSVCPRCACLRGVRSIFRGFIERGTAGP